MFKELRHAFRIFSQTKGWTAVVLLSLALGIGVNTTLFSAINSLLLSSIGATEPHSLVRLRWSGENQMRMSTSDYGYTAPDASGRLVRPTFSYLVYERLKSANQTLTGLFACAPGGRVNLVVDGQAELASAFLSTGNYFQVLGIPAAIGRMLEPGDDEPGAPPVAVISYPYWQSRFGGDPGVIGREATVNNVAVTVVGVTPSGYSGIQRLGELPRAVHLPLRLDRQINEQDRLDRGTTWWLQIVGRLKPGVTPEQVEGNLLGPFQAAAREGWSTYYSGLSEDERALSRNRERSAVPSLDVSYATRGIYDPPPSLTGSTAILGVVVLLLLLIVCANVANLLLSRASARRKELSIRLSLGATRRKLVGQLLTESVLLAMLGGALAMVVAYWSRGLLPAGQDAPLDWKVFCFAAGVSGVTGIAFGLLPALRATRVDLAMEMKETGRSLTRSRGWLGKSLLIVQVAVSLVLLTGAGLFLRTLHNLRNVEVGFKTDNLLLVSLSPRVNRYDQERSRRLYSDVRDAFAAVPGVESVSFSQTALLAGSMWSSSVHLQGSEDGQESQNAHILIISPEFLNTLQIPLLTGRNLNRYDDENAPRVALINEAAARTFFEGAEPLGRRFGFSPEEPAELEIVGVVGNAKYSSIRDQAPPTVYQSYLQVNTGSMTFEIRTRLAPRSVLPGIRAAARRVDPNLPLANISTQVEEVEEGVEQERMFAVAYSLFGGLALLLASIGLFGLMSYSVSGRTNEIGIRMALGAERMKVIGMILRESLILVAVGSAIGLAICVAAGRLIETQLYELAPTDPVSMVAATLLLFAVAGIAGYLPARKASRVDPLTALRFE